MCPSNHGKFYYPEGLCWITTNLETNVHFHGTQQIKKFKLTSGMVILIINKGSRSRSASSASNYFIIHGD